MTNSGGYNVADNTVAEDEDNSEEQTAVTESGEISTGANSNEIFSDSAPGEANSAAGNADKDEDDGTDHK